MKPTALRIATGSRRHGRCGRCRQDVTWATLAHRGAKNIPLVAAPMILRVEHGANGVSVEIIAFDQIHHCPTTPTTDAPRPTRTQRPRVQAHAPLTAAERGDHIFPAFTRERLAELRARIVEQPPAPKPPQTGRLW
jgi:hypothetical protein